MIVGGRTRGMLVALSVAGLVTGAAACGGSKPVAPVAVTHPAVGTHSPQAAVMGFFTLLGRGDHNACIYALQSVAVACFESFETETAKVSGLGVGRTTIDGSEALVTVVARLCVTQGGSTTCRTNTDPITGQPKTSSHAAFTSLYQTALAGTPISSSAVPCQEVGGQWFLSLAG